MTQHTAERLEARGLTIWEPGKTALSVASVNRHHPQATSYLLLLTEAPAMLAALEACVAVNALMVPNETLSGWAQRVQTVVNEARTVIARARGGA